MSVTRTQAPDWTGRMDPEDGPDAIRLNQLVKPGAKRAVIGFACDAGVKRNKGRIGAKEGPAALRQALANLSAPARVVRPNIVLVLQDDQDFLGGRDRQPNDRYVQGQESSPGGERPMAQYSERQRAAG